LTIIDMKIGRVKIAMYQAIIVLGRARCSNCSNSLSNSISNSLEMPELKYVLDHSGLTNRVLTVGEHQAKITTSWVNQFRKLRKVQSSRSA
jgi:hypothetical protein